MIEPGMEFAPEDFRKSVAKEVETVLDKIYATHGKGAWKKKLMINDRIADSIFQQVVTQAGGIPGAGNAQPERRLHFRRLRRAGRRSGHCPRSQHRRRLRGFRSHARHSSEVRGQRCHQPGLGNSVGRDDVPALWAGTKPRT